MPAVAAVGAFLGTTAGAVTAASVAGLAGAAISSSAAKSAAQTQATAANQATNVQQQMYNTTRGDLSPYNVAGQGALSSLNKLLGNDTGSSVTGVNGVSAPAPVVGAPNWNAYLSANPDVAARAQQGVLEGTIGPNGQWATPADWAAFHYQNTGQAEGRALPTYTAADVAAATPAAGSNSIESTLENLPGYQFTRDQGVQSVNRVLGSMGQTGAQAKGIARFVTGLADSTYNSQVANQQALASLGENAAAGSGNIGASYANSIGNNIVGAGTATASGQVGSANAINGAVGTIGNNLILNSILGGGNSASPNTSSMYSNANFVGNLAGNSTPGST